jgi:hypothetical protein
MIVFLRCCGPVNRSSGSANICYPEFHIPIGETNWLQIRTDPGPNGTFLLPAKNNKLTFLDRLAGQYQKAVSEVNETYQFYVSMLEERRAEITRYAHSGSGFPFLIRIPIRIL